MELRNMKAFETGFSIPYNPLRIHLIWCVTNSMFLFVAEQYSTPFFIA